MKEAFSRLESGVRAACSGAGSAGTARGRRKGCVRARCGGVAAALLRCGDGLGATMQHGSAGAAWGRRGSGVKAVWGLQGSGAWLA